MSANSATAAATVLHRGQLMTTSQQQQLSANVVTVDLFQIITVSAMLSQQYGLTKWSEHAIEHLGYLPEAQRARLRIV